MSIDVKIRANQLSPRIPGGSFLNTVNAVAGYAIKHTANKHHANRFLFLGVKTFFVKLMLLL